MNPQSAKSQPTRQRLPHDERREQLLETAIRVFSQKGFSGTKTKDIACAAGVTEAILFRHFPTKDELYAAILERAEADDWAESVRDALAVAGEDPRAFLKEFVHRTLSWHRRRPELLRLVLYSALERHELADLFRERQVRPVLELLTGYIAAGRRAGRFRVGVAPDHAARVVFGAVVHQGLVILLLGGEGTGMTDREAARAITEIALRGLENTDEEV